MMWPWSTIARLKSHLREAQDDASRFADRAGRANTEAEQYRQRWVTLNENYEYLKRHAGLVEKLLEESAANKVLAQTDARQWEAAYRKANGLWESTHGRESLLIEKQNELWIEVQKLRRQLALAVKNDQRDPKTGRFVKSQGSGSAENTGAKHAN